MTHKRNNNKKIANPKEARNILNECSLFNELMNTLNETNIAKKLIAVPIIKGNLAFTIALHVMKKN